MSLKILLADESPTIKKAFEIALKEYGVKIQSVHQGIDVKELCESFMPNICFLDVLLPKLNGYDASAQLKAEPKLSKIPTVIMWSGFMELDEDKFMTAGANGKIEKPFESEELRNLVQSLVPCLSSNEISPHLTPDPIPSEEVFGINNAGAQQAGANINTPPPSIPGSEELNLDSLDTGGVDDFSIENLGAQASAGAEAQVETSQSFEGLDDLDDFKIENLDDDSLPLDTSSGGELDDIFGDVGSSAAANMSKDDDIFGTLESEVDTSAASDDIFGTPPPPLPPEVQEASGLDELEPLKDEVPLPPPSINEEPEAPVATPPPPVSLVTEEAENTNPSVVLNVSQESEKIDSADAGLFKDSNSNQDGVPQLSKEELKRLILAQSKDIIESVVWDVVPELARELIQKEITKLMGKTEKENLEGDLR